MKITLSKKQWEIIGKKTGWIKKAQGAEGVEKVEEVKEVEEVEEKNPFRINELVSEKYIGYHDGSYNFSIELSIYGWQKIFEVKVGMSFEFEKAQYGGRTDPSWPDHFNYLGYNIESISGDKEDEEGNTIPLTDEDKWWLDKCVEEYCDHELADKFIDMLEKNKQENILEHKLDMIENRQT